MKNKIVGAILFALLANIVLVSAEPAISASYSLSDETPRAGSTIFYYVTVSNSGTTTAEDVEVRMIKSSSSYASTRGPGAVRLGDIAPGTSKTASFSVALGDTDVGVRRLNTKIIYESGGAEREIEHDTYFIVESTQLEVMDVSSTTDPLAPGEISTLKITLVNQQNEAASNFRFDLASGVSDAGIRVFRPLGGSSQIIDERLLEENTITVPYQVYVDPSITNGVYDAILTVEYIGGGIEKTETMELGIWVRGQLELDLTSVQTSPAEIKEGDEDVMVAFNVQNIGQELVKNLKTTFDPNGPFSLTASTQPTKSLGVLGAASSAPVEYYIDVEELAEAGSYDIPVTISFQDSQSKSYTLEKNLTIRIKETPILEIIDVQVPETVAQGQSADLTIVVKNVGQKKAQGASSRVIDKSDQPFDYGDKSDNIGILEPGETGEAVVPFSVDSDATVKEYGMQLELRYTDGEDVYTTTEVIDVRVVEAESSGFPVELVLVILLVIIGAVVWKLKGRRK